MVNFEDLRFDRKSGTARLSNRMNSILWTIDKMHKIKAAIPCFGFDLIQVLIILGSLQNQMALPHVLVLKAGYSNYLFKERTFSFNEDMIYNGAHAVIIR